MPTMKPDAMIVTAKASSSRPYRRSSAWPAAGSGSSPPAMYGAWSPFSRARTARGES